MGFMKQSVLSSCVVLAALAVCSLNVTVARADEDGGSSKVKVNALLQSWFYDDVTTSMDSFELRRAEVNFSGNISDMTSWFLMADLTHPGAPLEDLGINYKIMSGLDLTVGQFMKIKTAESLDSKEALWFPDLSSVALYFGDTRATGAKLTWSNDMAKVSVMTDNGTRGIDTTAAKDLRVRADLKPTSMFNVGAYYSTADSNFSTAYGYGVNAGVSISDLAIRAEWDSALYNSVTTSGIVADAAYSLCSSWQVAARWEEIMPGTTGATNGSDYGLGVNWLLTKNHSKIQALYQVFNNLTTPTSPTETGTNGVVAGAGQASGPRFILAFQTAI